MANEKIIEFTAKNIGPHEKLSFLSTSSAFKTGIYANNGSGKTFISRCLRLYQIRNLLNEEELINESNKLLRMYQTNGEFNFTVSEPNETKKGDNFKIKLNKDKPPVVDSNSDYIFHVFNSDYAKANLEISNYKPNGNIEGYVVGKSMVDISKEKKNLQKLNKELIDLTESLKDSVEKTKDVLKAYDVSIKINEFKNIGFDKLFENNNSQEQSLDKIKEDFERLKNFPTESEDIKNIKLSINYDFLERIEEFLSTKFDLSKLDEEFKNKIKSKQKFIELGIGELHSHEDGKQCPFCEQALSESAIKIVSLYREFIEDEEAININKASNFLAELDTLFKALNSSEKELYKVKSEFDELKRYFPSYTEKNIQTFKEIGDLKTEFEFLINNLKKKKDKVSYHIEKDEIELINQKIRNHISSLEKTNESNDKLIAKLNKTKNRLDKEMLGIKKSLCSAMFEQLKIKKKDEIKTFLSLRTQIDNLNEEISAKEAGEKKNKKKLVLDTFEYYLQCFFSDKYKLNRKECCLIFEYSSLNEKASNVLSDGEKCIVAFCYYLAETHMHVSSDDDYERIMFIIDDPVSSMDFIYVYCVSQCIRDLIKHFKIKSHKFLIMTHNLEFMSILTRNKLLKKQYILKSGQFSELKNELLLPYEHNLKDIYYVSIKRNEPSHTTPNSIRHILETISRFETRKTDLNNYLYNQEEFKENSYLYPLINDMSHGAIRNEPSYTDDQIVNCCKKVIEFIRRKFKGQITILEEEKTK